MEKTYFVANNNGEVAKKELTSEDAFILVNELNVSENSADWKAFEMSEMTYQVELSDENGNAEIIEENIDSLDKAEEKALNFVKYENNLSEYDKKKSYVVVSEIHGSFCNSISSFEFE